MNCLLLGVLLLLGSLLFLLLLLCGQFLLRGSLWNVVDWCDLVDGSSLAIQYSSVVVNFLTTTLRKLARRELS